MNNSGLVFLLSVFLFILSFSMSVNAGTGFPTDFKLNGINSDGETVEPGTILTFAMSELNRIIDGDFEDEYNSNRVKVFWKVDDKESDIKIDYDKSQKKFTWEVDSKYEGKKISLWTETLVGNNTFSANTKTYTVNKTGLPTPTNLKATPQSSSSINLTWSSTHGGNHYIYYKTGSSSYKFLAATSNGVYSKTINAGLSENTKYTFIVKANKSGTDTVGPPSNEASATTLKKESSSGSGSGSSGGSSGGSGSGSGSSGGSSGGSGSSSGGGSSSSSSSGAAKLSDAQVTIYSPEPGVATIKMTGHEYGIGVEVYKENTLVVSKSLGYYGTATATTSIPYGASTKFKYRVSSYGKNYSSWGYITVASANLGKPSLAVTKISKTRAGLKWEAVPGATGYRVYKGNKLIKTLSSKKKAYIVNGKGAGTAKYTVAAIRTISGSKVASGPKSKAVKGKANARTYNFSSSTSGMSYGKTYFAPKKIVLSGNTYTVTGYVKNSRLFKLIKLNKLDITLLCNGKKVGHKKITNYKMNVKRNGSKKITIKIKGKGGVDFRNAEGTTIKWSLTPYWEGVGTKAF